MLEIIHKYNKKTPPAKQQREFVFNITHAFCSRLRSN